MGKSSAIVASPIPFTLDHAKTKALVMQLLQFEDAYGKSHSALELYSSKLSKPHTLAPIYAIHRHVLSKFGFNTSDESVENYRTIFLNFYKSPTDYDEDVINCVYYMRNNKCVFYTKPKPIVGDKLTDCELVGLDGVSTVALSELMRMRAFKYYLVCSFSLS